MNKLDFAILVFDVLLAWLLFWDRLITWTLRKIEERKEKR